MTEAYIHPDDPHARRKRPPPRRPHRRADEASRALFGRAFRPDAAALAARIGATLAAERPPHDRSASCASCSPPAARRRSRFAGVSLYRGYDLRTVRPEAVSLVYDLPLGEYPTRHGEAADAPGGGAPRPSEPAVRVRDSGRLRTLRRTAPLFAATGHRAVTPPGPGGALRPGLPLPRSQRQE